MINVEGLQDLVTKIDDAENPDQLGELTGQLVAEINDCDDRTIDAWLEAEENLIGVLNPDDALLRMQAVTGALSLGANTVQRGARKVRQALNRWIRRLKTPLTNLKTTAGGTKVYLEVTAKWVTVGIEW
jgi:hypothetical protein